MYALDLFARIFFIVAAAFMVEKLLIKTWVEWRDRDR